MLTIDFIRAHGLDELCARYAITAKRHPEFPSLVFLKYSQIESPMGEPIAQECRGLMLDEANDWRVVSYPFRKFFNHGEGHAPAIDWPTARVYEKLDGSLMTLYWHTGEWRVASNGTPDAGGPVPGWGGTFADLFWQTWRRMCYDLPSGKILAGNHCFMFELTSPWNRVVVAHREPRLTLLGCRWLTEDLEEDDPEIAARIFGWQCVRSFPLGCLDDCLAACTALDPMESEGYVVRDAHFNRIKVKSPQYVALAHMRESVTARRLLEIIRTNEGSEFLTYFPEWEPAYQRVRERFDVLCDETDADYLRLKDAPDQKSFAAVALPCRWPSALFAIRKGSHATAREFAAACSFPALERVVGLDQIDVSELLSATVAAEVSHV